MRLENYREALENIEEIDFIKFNGDIFCGREEILEQLREAFLIKEEVLIKYKVNKKKWEG